MAAFLALPMNLLGDHGGEQVPGLSVTADFFATLGTPPLLGRTFRPGEYWASEPREVVLSYGAWQRLFGGRPDVIGKKLSIDASHHEVIGVMPPGFGLPNQKAELYVPQAIEINEGRNYSVIARLRPGVSPVLLVLRWRPSPLRLRARRCIWIRDGARPPCRCWTRR